MSLKNIWNNGTKFEPIENKWFILLFVPFVFFWLLWNYQKSITYDGKDDFYKNHINDEFKGTVHRKWYYHRSAYIKLTDSTEIEGYYYISKKVNKGDSIIKKKNSKEIILIKKDSIIYSDIYDENKFHYKLK